MPLASPGRYQSKLFRFLHRQTQQVSDRIGRTIRQVQVSTSWSVEAFLYQSFLLLKKAVDSARKQLNAQSSKNQHHLNQITQSGDGIEVSTTPTADAPILHMLEMVRNLPSRHTLASIKPKQTPINYIEYHQTEEVNEIVKATLPAVQGIATHLGNRHLVLVTADNKIIDILTLKQQQRLQDRIITEIADYWRLRRKAFDNQVMVEKKILPEIDRLLRKITGSNLASLPEAEKTSLEKEVKSELPTVEQIELIDAAMAKFEQKALVPVSRVAITVQQGSLQLLHVVKKKFNLFLYGNEIAITEGVEDLENQTPQIQALIWQAINHFFGNSTTQAISANQNDSSNKSIGKRLSPRQAVAALPKSRQSKKNIDDPWLTLDDLFVELPSTTPENPIPAHQGKNPRLPSKKANPRLLKEYTPGGLVTQPKSSHLAISSRKSGKITSPKPNPSKISVFDNRSNNNIDNEVEFTTQPEKTDFIEIKASTVGYDKHPLELALEWLDSLMLWLEDKFVKIIRFFKLGGRGKG
jgi:hypothetical protein